MVTKGAVDVLMKRTAKIQRDDRIRDLTEEDVREIEEQNRSFSEQGLRVLGVAYKRYDSRKDISEQDERDFIFLGLVAMMDPPRAESKAAVEECIRAGIRPVMITGDHRITAAAIAKRIGILKEESEACEGSSIDGPQR